MKVKLIWTDIQTAQVRQSIQYTPIAVGRGFAQMPSVIDDRSVVRIVFVDPEVSIFHALLDEENGALVIIDQKSTNGTFVNGLRQEKCPVLEQDMIQIGRYQIQVEILYDHLTQVQSSYQPPQLSRDSQTEWDHDLDAPSFSQICSSSDESFDSVLSLGNSINEPDFSQSYSLSESSFDESVHYQQNIDFTEADSKSLEVETETNFEQEMGAS